MSFLLSIYIRSFLLLPTYVFIIIHVDHVSVVAIQLEQVFCCLLWSVVPKLYEDMGGPGRLTPASPDSRSAAGMAGTRLAPVSRGHRG